MDSALRVFQLSQLWDKELGQAGDEEEERFGPVTYYSPESTEEIVVKPEDIVRLKRWIRSAIHPYQVTKKAAENAFPLYFQADRKPFTNGNIYGILNEQEVEQVKTIYCSTYNQRVDPALCISRSIIYPQEKEPSAYYKELEDKYKKTTDRKEKKRIRRELKKYSPHIDPYPQCRRCRIMKNLIEKSCLGVEYDPEDEECQACSNKTKCCQLMRLRVEKILAGSEEEVMEDILAQYKQLRKERKERKTMARKKKKVEDVTEEIIETQEEPETRGRRRRKKKTGDEPEPKPSKKKRSRKKKAEPEEEPTKTKKSRGKKKSSTGKGVTKKVKELLAELAEAKEEGDQSRARMIRSALRKEGYRLSDHKK